jgi:glycine cleavage system transcriptional repressor
MAQLVITAVGPDRPGLVGDLTRHVFEAGANLGDSRMVNLRGQFAVLVLVEGDAAALARVRSALERAAPGIGLSVTFAAEHAAPAPRPGLPFRLKSYSMDQPGIVHRVSELLRGRGVNIESLETRLESAAFAGSPVFTMEMRITIPPEVQIRALRRELEAACEALDCDVDLEPAS